MARRGLYDVIAAVPTAVCGQEHSRDQSAALILAVDSRNFLPSFDRALRSSKLRKRTAVQELLPLRFFLGHGYAAMAAGALTKRLVRSDPKHNGFFPAPGVEDQLRWVVERTVSGRRAPAHRQWARAREGNPTARLNLA